MPVYIKVPIPSYIVEHHSQVTLCIDYFFIQGIPFLHTIAQKLQFRTVSAVKDRKKNNILTDIHNVLAIYQGRGFTITEIKAHLEFECIRNDMRPIDMDIVPVDEHVGEIERSVRTTKETTRCTVQGLPYKRYPRLLMKGVIDNATRCLNQLPADDDLSDRISPVSLVTGMGPIDMDR